MGSTTRLGLQSRTTRLAEGRSDRPSPSRPHGAVTLRGGPFEVTRPRRGPRRPPSEDYNSEAPGVGDRPIPGLGFARFIRHYWGHPRWFLFLRLLICLNSAGGRARFEAEGGGGGTAAPAGGAVASREGPLDSRRAVPGGGRPPVPLPGRRGRGGRGVRGRARGGGEVSRPALERTRPGRGAGARFAFEASRIRAGRDSPESSHFAAFFLERRAEVSVVKGRAVGFPLARAFGAFGPGGPRGRLPDGPGPEDFDAFGGSFPPRGGGDGGALMIHLQVHLQIPCYDFFFL